MRVMVTLLFPAAKEVAPEGTTDQSQVSHLYNKVLMEQSFFFFWGDPLKEKFSYANSGLKIFLSDNFLSIYDMQMCFVLEDSAVPALNSHFGDKAASSGLANSLHKFEAVCEDVSRILRSHENGTTPKEEVMLDASSKETTSPKDPATEVPSTASKEATPPVQDPVIEAVKEEPPTVKAEDKMEIDS